MKTKKIKGKHFVFDLYGCDYHETNDPEQLEKLLVGAARAAKMEILHTYFHHFSPHGVTGVLVLSTSHISVHTWPEYGYAAFDVFSCSDEAQTRKAMNHITKGLTHNRKKIHTIDRGYAELKTIDLPVYKNNTKKTFKVHKKLAEIKNSFQKIQVLDIEPFGTTLMLDGLAQVSEMDHHLYDAAVTKLLRKTDKRILILGGGDGFVAEAILAQNPKAKIVIAELDPDIVYCAKTYFDKEWVFEHKNVTLHVGDALEYLKEHQDSKEKFDGIISDLTDTPIGSGKASARMEKFYNRLFTLSAPLLKEDGWIAAQAGADKVKKPLTSYHTILAPLMEEYFSKVEKSVVFIPSFLEDNVFLYARSSKNN